MGKLGFYPQMKRIFAQTDINALQNKLSSLEIEIGCNNSQW